MIELNAHAKVNLTLDIIERLNNGFHSIESIKQQIGLHDIIQIEPHKDIKIVYDKKDINPQDNIIFKAAVLLQNEYCPEEGAKITLTKNIPLAAGLAGGSTDAAATLIGLNKLWDLNLSKEELIKLASDIGSDVPFCVAGGACLAKGRGTEIEKIDMPESHLLLINPGFEVSTRTAYQGLDLSSVGKRLATRKLSILKEKTPKTISELMHNDFESTIFAQYQTLREIKQSLIENKAMNAILSGSGPTVFGLFEDEDALDEAYEVLCNKYPFVYKTKTLVN